MSDDKVIPLPGAEEEQEQDLRLEMERLNTLLGTAVDALGEAAKDDTPYEEFRDRFGRVKRLVGELEAVTEAIGVDKEPVAVQVRVRNEDGEDEQHEVVFPIYAKNTALQVRRIDSDMIETSIMVDNSSPDVQRFSIARSRVNFLGEEGVDYWLGRGEFASSEDEFNEKRSRWWGGVCDILEVYADDE